MLHSTSQKHRITVQKNITSQKELLALIVMHVNVMHFTALFLNHCLLQL